MAQNAKSNDLGFGSIIVGGLLALGGLLFLLVALLGNVPRILLIPPIVQIVLGLLGSTAGFLLKRGFAAAKLILVIVAIGIVANLLFLVLIAPAIAH